ncbi:hypothetical protein [Streptomyces cylindrosporus]|uniref:Uncharacterized protein n=1 Tax=Streptomyces cylindrosporus TaxID=2927583 RepID=A0ABS9YKB6_9ACTN|nr:hypothetical protein [Streptomyces cylindrosporus]MCI3277629.1 hypothetical protein [Streptomyces cylindrosporus]
MEAPPTEDSINKITTAYGGLRALYTPSVVAEAAHLLDALYETAAGHGHPREDRLGRLGGLITAAAEATSGKYGRPAAERTPTEIVALQAELGLAFLDEGLTPAASQVHMCVAVEPLPGGPRWGWDGHVGLAVALYADSGWELMVNQARTRVFTIHAPGTPEGAREVAAIVHSILAGDLEDPFRKTAWQ